MNLTKPTGGHNIGAAAGCLAFYTKNEREKAKSRVFAAAMIYGTMGKGLPRLPGAGEARPARRAAMVMAAKAMMVAR